VDHFGFHVSELWTSQAHLNIGCGDELRRTWHAEFGVTTTWRTGRTCFVSLKAEKWSLAILNMTAMVLSNPAALTSPNMPNIAMWRGSPESQPTWAPLMLPHPIPSDMHMLSQQCAKKNIWPHAFPSLSPHSSIRVQNLCTSFEDSNGDMDIFSFFTMDVFAIFYTYYTVSNNWQLCFSSFVGGIVAPESHPDLPALATSL